VAIVGPNSTGNAVRGNSIYGNVFLGIDLGDDGVTLNHAVDDVTGPPTSGPNNWQNYPLITAASPGTVTTASGTLNSARSTTFTLDFYASTQPDPRFYGGAQRWLGSAKVTTDAKGNPVSSPDGSAVINADGSFMVTLSAPTSSGDWLTATATGPGGTSEFSAARQLPAAPLALNSTSWTSIGPAPINGTSLQGLSTGRINVAAAEAPTAGPAGPC
jgi:hypothetical protein